MRTLLGLLSAIFLAAGPAAAQQQTQQTAPNQVFTQGPTNETALAQKIRHSLLMLPYYSIFDELSFSVNNGVVTLEGACPPQPPWDIRSDAANTVKHIPGVTKVINHIKLLPMFSSDWQIRRAEERAIYGAPGIGMRYGYQALPSIHIIVDAGHVTLVGVVDNNFDKTLIDTRAKTVPDVFSVTDDLRVLHPGEKKEK